MRKLRAESSSGKRRAMRGVIARTQARVSRSWKSTEVRSFTARASVARTDAESTSYCCAPAKAPPPPAKAASAKARLAARTRLGIGEPPADVACGLAYGHLR